MPNPPATLTVVRGDERIELSVESCFPYSDQTVFCVTISPPVKRGLQTIKVFHFRDFKFLNNAVALGGSSLILRSQTAYTLTIIAPGNF